MGRLRLREHLRSGLVHKEQRVRNNRRLAVPGFRKDSSMSFGLLRFATGVQQKLGRVLFPTRIPPGTEPSEPSGSPETGDKIPRLAPIREDDDQRAVPREILKKIRQIEIRTRRLVSETLAGQYHSAFRGQGMDFDEVREYQPGDDVRSIDWNVTARMNHPFVKKFREERELTVMLVVDLSGSGLFGSGEVSKRELAAEIASVLAFSAVRNQDKVGLLLFTETIEKFIRPAKGRRHVLRVIRDILYHRPRFRGTSLNGALEFLQRILPHRSVIVVLSDFLGETNPSRALMQEHLRQRTVHSESLGRLSQATLNQLSRKHDVIAVQVTDPCELELPNLGRLVLKDSETGEVVEINTADQRRREAFASRQDKTQKELERLFRAAKVDHLHVFTPETGQAEDVYIQELVRFFEGRNRKR